MKTRTSTSSKVQLAVLETRLSAQDETLEKLTKICEQTLAQATKTNGRVNLHETLIAEAEKNRIATAAETAAHRESVSKDLNEIKAWMKGVPMVLGAAATLCGVFAWMHSAGLIKF